MQQVNHIKASNLPINGSSFVPMGSQSKQVLIINALIYYGVGTSNYFAEISFIHICWRISF